MGIKYALDKTLFFSRTSDFLDLFLVKQCGKSRKTSESYRDGLTIFKRYVETLGYTILTYRFNDCTYEFLLDYKKYLSETLGYKSTSINQRIAAVKSYVKYAASCDTSLTQTYISIAAVPKSKEPKMQRPVIEDKDLKILMDAPPNTPKGLRDTLIMSLLYDTAIRLDELVHLTLGDIYVKGADIYLVIHGKGNKERKVSLDPKTSELLDVYLKEFHQKPSPKTPLIYTVIKGELRSMSHRNIQMILKKYGEKANADNAQINGSVHPHRLRRSRATDLYQNGVPIEMVARFLGHSSIDTTKNHYAFASLEQLRLAMQKAETTETDSLTALWKGHEDELSNMCGLRK